MDLLGYSASIFAALTRYPIAVDKGLMSIVENFILEELNLTKDCILAQKVETSDLYWPFCRVSSEYFYFCVFPLCYTCLSYPKMSIYILSYHGAKIVIFDTLISAITMLTLAADPLICQVPSTMSLVAVWYSS